MRDNAFITSLDGSPGYLGRFPYRDIAYAARRSWSNIARFTRQLIINSIFATLDIAYGYFIKNFIACVVNAFCRD